MCALRRALRVHRPWQTYAATVAACRRQLPRGQWRSSCSVPPRCPTRANPPEYVPQLQPLPGDVVPPPLGSDAACGGAAASAGRRHARIWMGKQLCPAPALTPQRRRPQLRPRRAPLSCSRWHRCACLAPVGAVRGGGGGICCGGDGAGLGDRRERAAEVQRRPSSVDGGGRRGRGMARE